MDALAREAGVRRRVEVLEHEELQAPVMCGIRRPAILLPADARQWTDAERRRALVHEMAHVRRGDWAFQLVVKGACAVYWFHPLAWMAARWLCLEAERACDDAVDGGERMDYADQLVMLARWMSGARRLHLNCARRQPPTNRPDGAAVRNDAFAGWIARFTRRPRGADVHARVWAPQGDTPQRGEYRTPLSAARRGRHEAVVAFLVSAGARD